MKKLLNIFILLTVFTGYTQDNLQDNAEEESEELQTQERLKHEASLDILDLLAFGVLDVSYEHLLNDYSSISLEIFNKLFNKNDREDVDLSQTYSKDFSLTGKFKYFWEEKQAQGFYAMALISFSHGKEGHDVTRTNSETGELETVEVPIEFSDLAPGVGVGYKYVTNPGFLIDGSAAVGRNLFHGYSPGFTFLSNVSIGFRF